MSLGEYLLTGRLDPQQVQQILLTLSVQARDAMPAGGTLAIQAKNAMLTELTPMSQSAAPPGFYIQDFPAGGIGALADY